MRTVVLAILGLVLGFFAGEALAAAIGIATNALSGDAPPDPTLWVLRSLPFIFAVAGALVAPIMVSRRGSR